MEILAIATINTVSRHDDKFYFHFSFSCTRRKENTPSQKAARRIRMGYLYKLSVASCIESADTTIWFRSAAARVQSCQDFAPHGRSAISQASRLFTSLKPKIMSTRVDDAIQNPHLSSIPIPLSSFLREGLFHEQIFTSGTKYVFQFQQLKSFNSQLCRFLWLNLSDPPCWPPDSHNIFQQLQFKASLALSFFMSNSFHIYDYRKTIASIYRPLVGASDALLFKNAICLSCFSAISILLPFAN